MHVTLIGLGPLFRIQRPGFSLLVVFWFSPPLHCPPNYPPPTHILVLKHLLKGTHNFYCLTLHRPVSSKTTLCFCTLPCYFVITSRSFSPQAWVQPMLLGDRLMLDAEGMQRQDKIPILQELQSTEVDWFIQEWTECVICPPVCWAQTVTELWISEIWGVWTLGKEPEGSFTWHNQLPWYKRPWSNCHEKGTECMPKDFQSRSRMKVTRKK